MKQSNCLVIKTKNLISSKDFIKESINRKFNCDWLMSQHNSIMPGIVIQRKIYENILTDSWLSYKFVLDKKNKFNLNGLLILRVLNKDFLYWSKNNFIKSNFLEYFFHKNRNPIKFFVFLWIFLLYFIVYY